MIPIPEEVRAAVVAAEQERNKRQPMVATPEKVVEILSGPLSSAGIDRLVTEVRKDIEVRMSKYCEEPVAAPIAVPVEVKEPENNTSNHKAPPKKIHNKLTLAEILKRTITKIGLTVDPVERYAQLDRIAKPQQIRPNTFVAKKDGDILHHVASIEMLTELFSLIDESRVVPENTYWGMDGKFNRVLRVHLPRGYVASVCAIQMYDLPKELFTEGKVNIVPKQVVNMRIFEVEASCPSYPPVLTNNPQMMRYNVMTVKIARKDMTLVNWFPGLHPNHRRYLDFQANFCIVGSGWDNHPCEK
jgi:hypothetical protein